MFSNKVKIAVDNTTRLGAVATAFQGKSSASSMMRLKTDKNGDQVLFCKKFSKTRFLATLGHKKSKEEIRTQAKAAMQQLVTMTDNQYGEGTAERIGLTAFGKEQSDGTINVLAGRVVEDLNIHAKIDKAFQDFGLYGDGHSLQSRNAATQGVKAEARQHLAGDASLGVDQAVNRAAARADALHEVEDKPVYDAMDALGVLTDAPPAERRLAQETIKGFATEAMKADASIPYSRAVSIGAFRYALQSVYEQLKHDRTFTLDLPRDLAAAAAERTNALAKWPSCRNLDKEVLNLAREALQKYGSTEGVRLDRVRLEALLNGVDDRAVLARAIQEDLKGATAGTALRGNTALSAVMKERAASDLKETVDALLDQLISEPLKQELVGLDKYDTNYKRDAAEIALRHLDAHLEELPIDELPMRFCQDVHLGLEEIEKCAEFNHDEKESIKMAFLVNQFALRVLNPAIFDRASASKNPADAAALTAVSVALQKAVNDPATNANYLAFMNQVAERGRAAA